MTQQRFDAILSALGEPYFSDGKRAIYCGDCRDLLPKIEAGSVDLVLTDPPYGVSFKGEEWDASIPNWLPLARAICDRVIFTTAPLTLWDYPRPDWVCCWHRPAAQSRTTSGGFNHWSPVVVYGSVKFAVDTKSLHAIKYAQPKGYEHPSPKPEALMRWLADSALKETGDVILDPFMGSGTTLRAAKDLDRYAIGIELEPKYCEIAKKRLAQAVLEFSEAEA